MMEEAMAIDKEISQEEVFALTMPKWDDFVVQVYREDLSLSLDVLESEIEECRGTLDMRYVLKTAEHIARAKSRSLAPCDICGSGTRDYQDPEKLQRKRATA